MQKFPFQYMFESGHLGMIIRDLNINPLFLGSSEVPHSAGLCGHPKEHNPVQNTGEYKCE